MTLGAAAALAAALAAVVGAATLAAADGAVDAVPLLQAASDETADGEQPGQALQADPAGRISAHVTSPPQRRSIAHDPGSVQSQ